jgi:hypothetical protein
LADLQRDHASVRGTIAYTSNQPERLGQERGREYFRIDTHADGSRTALAHCEIDDRPSVMRDICYSLDPEWWPIDCFVRISVGDRFVGSGWFRFGDDAAECEMVSATEGRVSQRMALKERLRTFQNHAIVCDAWHLKWFDRKRAGVQVIDPVLLSSPDHRGATGPLLFSIGMGVEFVGEERITVPAGTFDSLHFRFVATPGLPQEHPPYDVWCTDDGEFLFLRATVGGYMQTQYELTSLERS